MRTVDGMKPWKWGKSSIFVEERLKANEVLVEGRKSAKEAQICDCLSSKNFKKVLTGRWCSRVIESRDRSQTFPIESLL